MVILLIAFCICVCTLLIAFCICVCTLPMAHRLTTPQILLDMEDSEQESILGGHYAEESK